ncbi:MAG: sigma-70 family RNA polymerase sigma factor [Lachnospiraceae bacterium]|nr:sigma-70 family RNA polymerase sigma factor [Lachnospiraceae bacterium]
MEEEIVALLRSGDEKGIELVAERYEKLIRYIAVTILGGRETEVEECINDVYLKVWKSGAGYDYQKASFKTYLKAITRNTALNYLRKLQRLEELQGFDPEEDSLQEEYIDYRQNVEQKIIQNEEVEILNHVLASLRKKDKELVLRRFYYLQSTRQIAQAMDMSENAVDSKLSRLRKKIRKSYEEVLK